MIGEARDLVTLVTLVLVSLSQQSGGGDLTAATVVSKLTAVFSVVARELIGEACDGVTLMTLVLGVSLSSWAAEI